MAGNPAGGGRAIYLYGEYGEFSMTRQVGRKVSCYRSRNLTHWENCGVVLSVDTPRAASSLTKHTNPTLQRNPGPAQEARWARLERFRVQVGATIQRPKVLYNPKTKRYVMWMHWGGWKGFYYAHAAVASAKKAEGPYTYHGSFRPAGEMARIAPCSGTMTARPTLSRRAGTMLICISTG